MPIMYVRNFEYVCPCVWVCTLTSSPLSCGAAACSLLPWFWSSRTECVEGRREVMGESRKEEEEEEVGVCLEGAVCHCESAQGGSHHLAIDGRPSPVVKQAPVGLPEHWGHCVPPSQETYHPKCCYPHHRPPTASPTFLSLCPSPSFPPFLQDSLLLTSSWR